MKKLLCVFAHPDDESFCAGGAIALAAERGVEVTVVSATRGDSGTIAPGLGIARAELGKARERELREAAAVLGVRNVRFFDYLDGTLDGIDAREGAQKIEALMREFRPDAVVSFGEDGVTGHQDHCAVGAWTAVAFSSAVAGGILSQNAELYYCALPKDLLPPDFRPVTNAAFKAVPLAEISTIIVLDDALFAKKEAALRLHASQREDVAMLLHRPPELVRKEYFRRMKPAETFSHPFSTLGDLW